MKHNICFKNITHRILILCFEQFYAGEEVAEALSEERCVVAVSVILYANLEGPEKITKNDFRAPRILEPGIFERFFWGLTKYYSVNLNGCVQATFMVGCMRSL